MRKVGFVTGYVDLDLNKRPASEFHELGTKLFAAAHGHAYVVASHHSSFDYCWVNKEPTLPWKAANPRASDRFVTDDEHIRSNIIQHMPVQLVELTARDYPDVDVWVWMGYSLLKQGDFTGKHIRPQDVSDFLDKLAMWDGTDIPYPGIIAKQPLNPYGDNWRFCGSTVIFPRQHLDKMVYAYKECFRRFIQKYRAIPLDLAIWPMVEDTSALPFRFYQAEYDYTQLTNFPG